MTFQHVGFFVCCFFFFLLNSRSFLSQQKEGLGSLRWYVTNPKKKKGKKFKQYLNILKYVNSLNVLLLISCILAVFDFIAFFKKLNYMYCN